MIDEKFLSGFCRNVDGTRMVTLEYEETEAGRELLDIDCSFETCIHRGSCEIGKAIEALLQEK